jgi:hypothetical protein
MINFVQDLRFACRMLRKNLSFSLIGFLTLALGIGATTSIFSVVYGVLLRPLPFERPDQIVRLWEQGANGHHMNFADPNFDDVYAQSHSFQGLAEYAAWPQPVSGGSEPTSTLVATVSGDFFPLMGVQPVRGRGFVRDDQRSGATWTALVSYGYWQQYLGSSENLSAAKLTIDNHAVSVIGVLPAGFRFPDDSLIWLPRELRAHLPSRTAHNWHVVGRLRDGVSTVQAHAELAGIARQIKQQYGQDSDLVDISIVRLKDALTSDLKPALMVLLGAVAFLLLIACANVANLMLVQAGPRERTSDPQCDWCGTLAVSAAVFNGSTSIVTRRRYGGSVGRTVGGCRVAANGPGELDVARNRFRQLPSSDFRFGDFIRRGGWAGRLHCTTSNVEQRTTTISRAWPLANWRIQQPTAGSRNYCRAAGGRAGAVDRSWFARPQFDPAAGG